MFIVEAPELHLSDHSSLVSKLVKVGPVQSFQKFVFRFCPLLESLSLIASSATSKQIKNPQGGKKPFHLRKSRDAEEEEEE